MNIKYQNLGANETVPGSCHLIEVAGLKILVDFGIMQDSSNSFDNIHKFNSRELSVKFSEIDYIILTHAHLDHVGLLGRLPSENFKGKIICTALTSELINLNLRDAAYLHTKEIERINKRRNKNKINPLYTMKSIDSVLNLVRGYGFNQKITLSEKVKIELLPASHISGASMPLITYREGYGVKRVLFTGDTGGVDKDIPFTMKPKLNDLKIDMIVSESTYGSRENTESDITYQLEKYIEDTCISNGATLLIPSFAIARSTNLLFYLKQIYDRDEKFKDIPIFLASPMACKSHFIIGREDSFNFYDKEWYNYKDLWKWDGVNYIDNFKEVKSKLANGHKKIIITSSGMLQGGYSNYLASIFLPHKKSRLLFAGYQGIGTKGRKLIEGNQKTINIDGKPVKLRANIDMIRGLSSHASGSEIVSMFKDIEKKKLKKVILVHGDKDECLCLKKKFLKEFKDIEVIIPKYKEIIKI